MEITATYTEKSFRGTRKLELFKDKAEISSTDLVVFFGIKSRTATDWCSSWVEDEFLVITNSSRKARRYKLAEKYEKQLF